MHWFCEETFDFRDRFRRCRYCKRWHYWKKKRIIFGIFGPPSPRWALPPKRSLEKPGEHFGEVSSTLEAENRRNGASYNIFISARPRISVIFTVHFRTNFHLENCLSITDTADVHLARTQRNCSDSEVRRLVLYLLRFDIKCIIHIYIYIYISMYTYIVRTQLFLRVY